MNQVTLINPRPALEGLEIGTARVVRVSLTKTAVQFITPDAQDGLVIEMPNEVLDKLALAVVQFIQAEAVKANQEKQA